MAEKVLMLALSPTMETGTIAGWSKKEGDEITTGDVLCEVETDKATMEYESIQEGTLLKIMVSEGESAVVEQPIAIVGAKGEDISELIKEIEAHSAETSAATDATTPAVATPQTPVSSEPIPESPINEDGRIKASPLARVLAAEAGIDIARIQGSGPEGRIVKRDVERAKKSGVAESAAEAATASAAPNATSGAGVAPFGAQASPSPLKDETVPVSTKRRVIAQRLAESKYSAPHFYLKISVITETMMNARSQLNTTVAPKVSVNAFLLKFSAEAIKRNPDINSSWQGDTIRRFGSINIGLAVAQPDGLITPIVRDCGAKGIVTIDRELSELIARSRENKLTPEDYTGATFTISSLGTFGIEEFTAIINPPGSAILAVGQMQKVPVVDTDDKIVVRNQMKLTLSCDHRVIDGAKGAVFLSDLRGLIEDPVRALY